MSSLLTVRMGTGTNCSRWMPVYILDMLELPAEIKSVFEKGEFSIRQTSGSFNGICSDMGTEKPA